MCHIVHAVNVALAERCRFILAVSHGKSGFAVFPFFAIRWQKEDCDNLYIRSDIFQLKGYDNNNSKIT